MQTTTWSAEDIRSEFSDASSLAEVISAIENRLWTQGEVVCEVRVNGMFLDEKDEERFAEEKLEGVSQLEIKTQKPWDLLLGTVDTATTYIPKVKESALLAAEYFQQGRQIDAHNLLTQLLDSSTWLVDLLFLIKKSCYNWAEVGVKEDEWRVAELMFAETLRTLYSSYEKKDYVTLADFLEYEFTNALDKWLEVLHRVDKIMKGDKKP